MILLWSCQKQFSVGKCFQTPSFSEDFVLGNSHAWTLQSGCVGLYCNTVESEPTHPCYQYLIPNISLPSVTHAPLASCFAVLQEIDVKAGGGHVMTIGDMLRQWLVKLEWYSTLFPRIPVPIEKDLAVKLKSRPVIYSQPEPEPEHIADDQVSFGEAERRRGYDGERVYTCVCLGRENNCCVLVVNMTF